jgi:predicted SnoaL-like aldol condensation-catalyzing enzyme
MIRTITLLLLLVLSLNKSHAQSFHVSDTLITMIKQTDNGIVHYYSELFNDTDSILQMRWVRHTADGYPANWITYLQDPQTYYNPLMQTDSADFYLDTIQDSWDKLIYQVNHQGNTGRGTTMFTVFPIHNRADSVHVTFTVKIIPASSGTSLLEIINEKGNQTFKSILIFDINGQLIAEHSNIKLSVLTQLVKKGLVFVRATDSDNQVYKFTTYLN